MSIINNIKERVRSFLKPLAKNIDIDPNILTIFGLLITIISAIFFARREIIIAGFLLIIGGLFDVFDGIVARENNKITKFGGFLDSVTDRFSDAIVIIGIIYGELATFPNFPEWFIGIFAIVGSMMVSYTRARAEMEGISATIGIGERSIRIIIIIIGTFVNLINWAILLVAIICFITVIQRITFTEKMLR